MRNLIMLLCMFLVVGLGFAQPPDKPVDVQNSPLLSRINSFDQSEVKIVETVYTVDNLQFKNYNITTTGNSEIKTADVSETILHIDPGRSTSMTTTTYRTTLPQVENYNYNNKNQFVEAVNEPQKIE